MSWKKVYLGDYCIKIGSGATPKGGATVYIDAGVSLIRSQNVYNLSFSYDGLTRITDDAAEKLNGVTIYPNDILLNITGDSVARVCMVPVNVLPARVNQHVAIIRTSKDLLPQYLLYYLASPYMQAYMLNLAVGKGASRNALTKGMIEDFPLLLPSVEEQQRIIDILSPYSVLIENNQKQIKLLEEAAQRLYKEWFVDLRFPGHETTPIINGIPEGWTRCTFKDLVEVKYGKDHKNLDDGSIPVYGSGGLMRKCAKSLYKGESVLIPRKGSLNNIMYVDEEFWTVDTMFYTKMKMEHVGLFSYFFAKSFDMYSMNIGAAVPSTTTNTLDALDVVLPTKVILEKFDQYAKVYYNQIGVLTKQIEVASEARDRLLPKLMNGEIEI